MKKLFKPFSSSRKQINSNRRIATRLQSDSLRWEADSGCRSVSYPLLQKLAEGPVQRLISKTGLFRFGRSLSHDLTVAVLPITTTVNLNQSLEDGSRTNLDLQNTLSNILTGTLKSERTFS